MALIIDAGQIKFNDGTTQTSAYSVDFDQGRLLRVDSYTSAGTYYWTSPANTRSIRVQVVGGGGGGSGHCESGGAGGYAEGVFAMEPNATVTVVVGGGGASVGYYAAASDGGTSSFGTYCSASGGYGANRNYSHTGGHSGIGSGGSINLRGGSGSGHSNGGYQEPTGGGSFFGGPRAPSHNSGSNLTTGSPGAGGRGGCGSGNVNYHNTGEAGAVIIYSYS